MREVLIQISTKQSEGGHDHYLVSWRESGLDTRTVKLPIAKIEDRFDRWNDAEKWRNEQFRQESGDHLFQLLDLFQDDTGDSLLKTLIKGSIATLTFQIEDSKLRTFPWELIRFQNLSLVSRHCLKFRSSGQQLPPHDAEPEDWPLRILAIKATSDDDSAETGVELDHIRQTALKLGPMVNLQVMEQPDEVEITKTLESFKPHIFHFSGHGKFNEGNSFLTLAGKDGLKQKWTIDRVTAAFGAHCPQCVILNACETSKTNAEVDAHGEEIWSVAESLLAIGCRNVIAMQGAIRSSEATVFGHEFFRNLASQLSKRSASPDLTAAFHAARRQLTVSLDCKDWCLPRLLENASLPKRPIFKPIQQTFFIDNDLFRGTFPFLDRYCYREKFGIMTDFFSSGSKDGGLILHAEKESGLTYLLRFIIATAELNGCLVDYQSYDQLTSLRQPIEKFIEDILEDDLDEVEDYEADDHGENWLPAMFRHLDNKAAERNCPTIIAFDHISKKENPTELDLELTKALMNSSFCKSYPHLRIILAMHSETFTAFQGDNAIPRTRWQIHEIEQKLIPNFTQHYREYIRYHCEETGMTTELSKTFTFKMMEWMILTGSFADPKSPAVFKRVKGILENAR